VNSSLIASQTRETVDFDRAASAPSASARVASKCRTDRPRTNPAISNAFVFVNCGAEQPGRERLGGAGSFDRATVTGPATVLTGPE
jgi:hypothetical protein